MNLGIDDANEYLSKTYEEFAAVEGIPYREQMQKLWEDKRYQAHGPSVLDAMNKLLSDDPEDVLEIAVRAGNATVDQQVKLRSTVNEIKHLFGQEHKYKAFFRIAAFYHDIGKYIMHERHPKIGWYIIQYIEPKEKRKLQQMLSSEELLQRFLIIIRDHDQFGVLSTGEASYPILLRTISSVGSDLLERKRIIAALFLCNLADVAGTIDRKGDGVLKGKTVDILINDLEWALKTLDKFGGDRIIHLEDHIIKEASTVTAACERILRILQTATQTWPERAKELNDIGKIRECLANVLGSQHATREFAKQFACVCKIDYGKRFFDSIVEYCEGPAIELIEKENRFVTNGAPERVDTDKLIYAVLSILQRITSTYSSMVGQSDGPSNLIGVELKDLTPKDAPAKTTRIIDLLLTSGYPGLTWLMSDTPAWYF